MLYTCGNTERDYIQHYYLMTERTGEGKKSMKETERYSLNPLLIAGSKRQIVSSHVPKVAEKMVGIILTGSKLLHFNLFLKYLERESFSNCS